MGRLRFAPSAKRTFTAKKVRLASKKWHFSDISQHFALMSRLGCHSSLLSWLSFFTSTIYHMKKLLVVIAWLSYIGLAQAQYNNLWIPDTLSGTHFTMVLKDTMKVMHGTTSTITAAVNNADFWGPTLIMNKNDSVFINMHNTLNDSMTVHWHGMHGMATNQ
jgi:hypothetical protein